MKSKDRHPKEDKGKKETYGTRSLKWSAEKNGQAGCGAFCQTGDRHYVDQCPRILNGSVTENMLKKKGYCTCCIKDKKKCTGGNHKNKAGVDMKINCASCDKHKRLPVHQQCSQRQESQDGLRVPQPRGLSNNSGTGVTAPPLTMVSALPAASFSELRNTSYTYQLYCQ